MKIPLHEFGEPPVAVMEFLAIAMQFDDAQRRLKILADGAADEIPGLDAAKLQALLDKFDEPGFFLFDQFQRILLERHTFE